MTSFIASCGQELEENAYTIRNVVCFHSFDVVLCFMLVNPHDDVSETLGRSARHRRLC
jgi:hypothetical protein